VTAPNQRTSDRRVPSGITRKRFLYVIRNGRT
jgi:hypothetical protein